MAPDLLMLTLLFYKIRIPRFSQLVWRNLLAGESTAQ